MHSQTTSIHLQELDKEGTMGLIKPNYWIIKPGQKANFSEQLNDCAQQLAQHLNNTAKAFRINTFIKAENESELAEKSKLISNQLHHLFGKDCPPLGMIAEAPEQNHHLLFEVGYIEDESATVDYQQFDGQIYCSIEKDDYREIWTLGTQASTLRANTTAAAQLAFKKMYQLYNQAGIDFNHIVRQWNYVGEILQKEQENDRIRQHYQMFNEVRSEFYGKYRSRKDFPAATGIGVRFSGVAIDSFAIAGNDQVQVTPISNPGQSESYKYGQEVLVGAPEEKRRQNQPPQFERATLITAKNSSRLIISGTASIIGQETIGIGDVEEQTRVTINNIEKLSSSDNIKKHCPSIDALPTNYSYVRVYVKLEEDFDKVKAICTQHFGDVPATFVRADICRDNLLVEIEAEKVS